MIFSPDDTHFLVAIPGFYALYVWTVQGVFVRKVDVTGLHDLDPYSYFCPVSDTEVAVICEDSDDVSAIQIVNWQTAHLVRVWGGHIFSDPLTIMTHAGLMYVAEDTFMHVFE